MLHKLALVTTTSVPSLLEEQFIDAYIKEAMISAAEHARQMALLEAKAIQHAQNRGATIPLKDTGRGLDDFAKDIDVAPESHGKPGTRTTAPKDPRIGHRAPEFTPDLENARLNQRGAPRQRVTTIQTPHTQTLKVPGTNKATINAAGEAVTKPVAGGGINLQTTHTVPGGSVSPRQGSALLDKETQKAYGNVSNSKLKQMRHAYWGGAKRFFNGKGLTGNKWGNRGAAVAGVGALGLGMKAYLDSNKLREEPMAMEQPMTGVPEVQQLQQQLQQQQYPGYEEYGKTGSDKYSPDAVTIPKPTAQPTVKALGPGIGTPNFRGSSKGGGGLLGGSVGGGSVGGGSVGGGSSSSGKTANDSGVLPLMGAAAGGVAGWGLGQKLLVPAIEQRQAALAATIAKAQAKEKVLKSVASKAPMGAAAAGALLLAALAALYAKKSERAKVQMVNPGAPYDPTGAGFQQPANDPYRNFYG